jgi:Type II secretion system (T2SS), protein E, N-terminal domain
VSDEALAIAFRSGLPYVGLRDHAHDPALDRIVPPAAARTARVIPLAAADDHIRLAVADPDTDLSALDRYLTDREVQLAVAPREELEAILGPPAQDEAADAPEQIAVAEPEPELPATDDEPAPAGEAEQPTADPAAAPPEALDDAVAIAADSVDTEPPPSAEVDTEQAEAGPSLGTGSEEEAEPAEATIADHALAAEPEQAAPEPEPAGPTDAAERAIPLDDHPELAGEVPSWLEAPRRGWRVVLIVLVAIVLLAAAAAVLVAVVNP